MRRSPLVLLLMVLAVACRDTSSPAAQDAVIRAADVPIPDVVASTAVRSSDPSVESPKEYEFAFGRDHFKLDRGGRFSCRTATSDSGSCQLDLEELPNVEKLQIVRYGGDVLLLLYELSDGEGGISRISRIDLPACELEFTSDIPGFNLGPAVLEQSSLYVTAIGFVGRFNVETWGFDWSHGNLYERYELNAFGAPTVYRDRVVFPEMTTFSQRARRNVIVEKASGAMRILPQGSTTATQKTAG